MDSFANPIKALDTLPRQLVCPQVCINLNQFHEICTHTLQVKRATVNTASSSNP